MGYLARGTWVDEWYDTASSGGRFVRQDSRFRSRVRRGGDHPPEPGRSSVCFVGLSVGQPDHDLPCAQGPQG